MTMVDQTVALQVKPLDIATPLMQAAKMRQMESEQQRLTEADNREAVASEMRGLAPYASSPDFAGRWTQSIDNLAQAGKMRPDIAARMRDNPSVMAMHSVLAQAESPEMQFRRQQADQQLALHREDAVRSQSNIDREYRLKETDPHLQFQRQEAARAQSNADRAFNASQDQAGAPTVTTEAHDFMGNKTSSTSQRLLPGQQPYSPPAGAGTQAATGIPVDPNTGQPMQGQKLLAHLKKTDPVMAAGIESIIRGDTNAGGRNLQKMLPLAALIDPSLQQFDYATRSKTALAFGPAGPVGLETKAMNTALMHAESLSKVSAKLGGTDIAPGVLNPIIQGFKRNANVEGAQEAQKEWQTLSGTLAVEVSKALNGGRISEGEREKWRAVFEAANSPQERKAALKAVMYILDGRLESNKTAWVNGMGPNRAPPQMIYPQNQKTFDRLRGLPETAGAAGNDDAAKRAAAVERLKANPKESEMFDQVFGAGEAARALGVLK